MTKKFINLLTLAAAFAGVVSTAKADGDIFEIRPCNALYQDWTPTYTKDSPMIPGQKAYFYIRFAGRAEFAGEASRRWQLNYIGMGGTLDAQLNPLQIGIFAAGTKAEDIRWATLIDTRTTVGTFFTDLIFEYEAKPGDFALPIVLATKDASGNPQPAGYGVPTTEYYLNPVRYGASAKWLLSFKKGDDTYQANWTYHGNSGLEYLDWDGTRNKDYSLRESNFHIKSFDFDPEWEQKTGEGAFWRSVHMGSTNTEGPAPQIVVNGTNDQAVTLYVWSTNENVVVIRGGTPVTMPDPWNIPTDPTATATFQVGRLTFAKGQTTADFQIEGVNNEDNGGFAGLVLSASDHFTARGTTGTIFDDFVGVPVKCIEPLPPTLKVEINKTSVTADPDYLVPKAEITVSQSEPWADHGPLDVTVTASFTKAGADASTIGTYLALSTDSADGNPTATSLTVTIAKDGTRAAQKIYVYALGADDLTSLDSAKILFTPTVAAADQPHFEPPAGGGFKTCSLKILKSKPVITSMGEGGDGKLKADGGVPCPLYITVSDTFADKASTNGYQILVQKRKQEDITPELLDEYRYMPDGDGVLYRLDAEGKITSTPPSILYTVSGENDSVYFVKAPVSGKQSDGYPVTVDVAAPATIEMTPISAAVNEGEEVEVTFTLSRPNTSTTPYYVFLRPLTDDATNLVEGTCFATTNTLGYMTGTDSTVTRIGNSSAGPVSLTFTALDGSEKGTKVPFEAVVCASPSYDASKVITRYSSGTFNLTIRNVHAKVNEVLISAISKSGATNDYGSVQNGEAYGQIAKGKKRFQLDVDDVDPDLHNGFVTRWSVGGKKWETKTGDVNELVWEYDFQTAGLQEVTVQVMDKDTYAAHPTGWTTYSTQFSFTVEVVNTPQILVTAPTSVSETDTVAAELLVDLSFNNATNDVRVEVALYPADLSQAGKMGNLEFTGGGAARAVGATNVYEVTFPAGSTETQVLYINTLTLDGTTASETSGWNVFARVVSAGDDPESETPLSEYYKMQSKIPNIKVYNVAPTLTLQTQAEWDVTNRKVVAAAVYQTGIRWGVDDVIRDITNANYITVQFFGADGYGPVVISNRNELSGIYTPDFSKCSGPEDVQLIVTDKDGGVVTRTWYFIVQASKQLETYPNGPTATASSQSQKYRVAKGSGDGHVWVDVSSAPSVKGFVGTWNCGSSTKVNAYAWGYKTSAPKDNGALDSGRDVAIDKDGNKTTGTDYYEYGDKKFDSFLYGWIQSGTPGEGSDDAGAAEAVTVKLAPELPGKAAASLGVKLPNEKNDDGIYAVTQIEAVFSKERFAQDNVGDINQDGIPDLKVLEYGLGVYDPQSGAFAADDTKSVADFNDDGDLLPAAPSATIRLPDPVSAGTASTNETSSSSTSRDALDFTALYEIRGYHKGLNNPAYSEMDMSKAELRAFKRFLKKTDPTLDVEDAAVLTNAYKQGLWTPENPTDPTKADTDGDGLPDGYEYYFWYCAHVFGVAGEKYGFWNGDLAKPTPITPEEIEQLYDPNVPHNWASGNDDTDGDGLLDLEEYLLGTNPIHWDSDRDGVPDGLEVMRGMNPRVADSTGDKGNPDGDFMALEARPDQLVVEVETVRGGVTNVTAWGCDNVFKVDSETGKTLYRYRMVTAEEATPVAAGMVLLSKDDKGGFTVPVYYFEGDATALAEYADDDQVLVDLPLCSVFGTTLKAEDGTEEKFYWRGASKTLSAGFALTTVPATDAEGKEVGNSETLFKWATTDDFPVLLPALVKTSEADADVGVADATNVAGFAQLYRYGGENGAYAIKMTCSLDTAPGAPSEIKGRCTYYGGNVTNVVNFGTNSALRLVRVSTAATVNYLHAQVFAEHGFDPRTGWGRCKHGFCGTRWCKTCAGAPEEFNAGESGRAVNTSAFTSRDEYLVLQYAYESGLAKIADDLAKVNSKEKTLEKVWSDWTTNPGGSATDLQAAAADTDGDGVADGWECYVLKNPNSAKEEDTGDDDWGLLAHKDGAEGDGLELAAEFAGTDVFRQYADCPTIGHQLASWIWLNKFFPTNPYSADTDGDGLTDAEERASGWKIESLENTQYTGAVTEEGSWIKTSFIYGPNGGNSQWGSATDSNECCIRGGGLNPCSVDTDGDRLPDLWEYQFAGKWVPSEPNAEEQGGYIRFGMDGTDGFDAFTFKRGGKALSEGKDPRTGSWRNFDFDLDGLENWQEYLTQTLRHFRYDVKAVTTVEANGAGTMTVEGVTNTTPMYVMTPDFKTYDFVFGPASAAFAEPADKATRRGFFGSSPHAWDPNDLRKENVAGLNRILLTPGSTYMLSNAVTSASAWDLARGYVAASVYASTDPRMRDTDQDGIDDFCELYHGLNPLLGGSAAEGIYRRDIISEAYGSLFCGMPITCYRNAFTDPDEADSMGALALKPCALDFVKYPWLAGLGSADPDGDGRRNEDEKIEVNTTTPSPSNTDPTPLWMTDSAFPYSYTARFYPMSPSLAAMWAHSVNADLDTSVGAFMYSFEMNEGYDTDNDGFSDGEEVVKTVLDATDPQRYTDPQRRQALYFPGDATSLAMSVLPSYQVFSPLKIKYNNQAYSASGGDFFRQFTVEAWVKLESLADATILEKISLYPSSNKNSSDAETDAQLSFVRANFRVGLKDGAFYALADNSDARESGSNPGISCVQVISPVAVVANRWYHLAVTFDGASFAIVVNTDGDITRYGRGTSISTGDGFIPANGVFGILQQVNDTFPIYAYAIRPSALVLGASADKIGLNLLAGDGSTLPSAANYSKHFKGYIADVRIWDGARTPDEVAADFDRRLSREDLLELRGKVYDQWSKGGTRSATDGTPMLPAELIFHYTMDGLHGATDPAFVASTPGGYQANVVKPVADTLGSPVYSGWLEQIAACGLGNTVYTSRAYIPWVKNQAARLPYYDGSVADSVYWGENLAGDHTAASVGVKKFVFPRTANPYVLACNAGDIGQRSTRYQALMDTSTEELASDTSVFGGLFRLYCFDIRCRMSQTTDLLPLGGVYAKRDTDYWDGLGPMDADVLTTPGTAEADVKGNGLPDWWEQYCRDNYFDGMGYDPGRVVTLDTLVNYDGRRMQAWEAYYRDLARGMLPDTTVQAKYRDEKDADGDGLPDWWEEVYGLAEATGLDDSDNDGLNNYVEYLLSEVFRLPDPYDPTLYAVFDPTDATSADGKTLDYFFSAGKLYVGEIFTDHDQIEDSWENFYTKDYVSPLKYDAHEDNDGDGWSAFAEARYSKLCTPIVANNITHYDPVGGLVADYPVPGLHLRLNYSGKRVALAENSAVVVKFTRDQDRAGSYDAEYEIAGVSTEAKDVSVSASNAYQHVLGKWSNRRAIGMLTPGFINVNSLALQVAYDPSSMVYSWSVYVRDKAGVVQHQYQRGSRLEYDEAVRTWGQAKVTLLSSSSAYETLLGVELRTDEKGEVALLHHMASNLDFGTVNLKTGEYDVNLGVFENGYVTSTNGQTTASLEDMTYRFAYSSNPSTGIPRDLYLGTATRGWVKEGKNTVVAWFDLDNDGRYTPGEPYGFARDVDISWKGRDITLDLTDTSPVFARYDLVSGATDRETVFPSAPDVVDVGSGTVVAPGNTSVRVYRYAIDSLDYTLTQPQQHALVFNRTLPISDSVRTALTESDILSYVGNEFDLDWSASTNGYLDLCKMAKDYQSTSPFMTVYYVVTVGNADATTETELQGPEVLSKLICRRFDRTRQYPTPLSPANDAGAIVTETHPTFTWTMNGFDTYPAFSVKVTGPSGFAWESGYQRAPAPDANGVYSWTAPICAGAKTPDGRFEFKNGETYSWSVAMCNAKFRTKDAADYRAGGSFVMNVPTNGLYIGALDVSVRYFGPAATTVPIRVQAFASADFTGLPAAEGYVYDTTKLADRSGTYEGNARLIGLDAGTYYIRAFIDTQTDGQRAPWETWGYYCGRGFSTASCYDPIAVSVGPSIGKTEGLTVYLDDCDVDQDCLPDAWEWDAKVGLAKLGATDLSSNAVTRAAGIQLKSDLADKLAVADDAAYAPGLAGLALRSLTCAPLATLALGSDGGNPLEVSLDQDSVEISDFAVGTDGKVYLRLSAATRLESGMDPVAAQIYSVGATVKVNASVLWKASLADPTWQVHSVGQIDVVGSAQKDVAIDLSELGCANAAFFKIKLEIAK